MAEDITPEELAVEFRLFFVQNPAGQNFIQWLREQGSPEALMNKPLAEIETERLKINIYRNVLEQINNTIEKLNTGRESSTNHARRDDTGYSNKRRFQSYGTGG